MTIPSVEIIRARHQVAQASLLRKVAQSRCKELVAEMQRGETLRVIADAILKPPIYEALLTLPPDGSWSQGGGRHWRIISDMLDQGSPLIEEDAMPDDGDAPWRVRLSQLSIAMVVPQPLKAASISP